MCNHLYKTQTATTETEQCSWRDVFLKKGPEGWKILPHDSRGLCIFHSIEDEFKKENKIWDWFQLAIELSNHPINKETPFRERLINFNGFILIGERRNEAIQEKIKAKIKNDKAITENRGILISGITFYKNLYFSNSILKSVIDFEICSFECDLDLSNIQSNEVLSVRNCNFKGHTSLSHSSFNQILIEECHFHETIDMVDTEIHSLCNISYNHFNNVTSFIKTRFYGGSTNIENNIYNQVVFYDEAKFFNTSIFDETLFNNQASFVNTEFNSDVYFNNIKVRNSILFQGKPELLVFKNRVYLNIDESDFTGTITFEYANVSLIDQSNREQINTFIRDNKIIYGKGCVKYNRIYSINVHLTKDLIQFSEELSRIFTSFFNIKYSIHLGVELNKVGSHWEVLFFTDDNISKLDFQNALFEGFQAYKEFSLNPLPLDEKDFNLIDNWARTNLFLARVGLNAVGNPKLNDNNKDFVKECFKPISSEQIDYKWVEGIINSYNRAFSKSTKKKLSQSSFNWNSFIINNSQIGTVVDNRNFYKSKGGEKKKIENEIKSLKKQIEDIESNNIEDKIEILDLMKELGDKVFNDENIEKSLMGKIKDKLVILSNLSGTISIVKNFDDLINLFK